MRKQRGGRSGFSALPRECGGTGDFEAQREPKLNLSSRRGQPGWEPSSPCSGPGSSWLGVHAQTPSGPPVLSAEKHLGLEGLMTASRGTLFLQGKYLGIEKSTLAREQAGL